MSNLVRPDAWGNVAQDINTLYQFGKWSTILGTGYLIARNPKLGLTVLARSAWIVGTASVRTAINITKLWRDLVFNPAFNRWRAPPPPPRRPPVELIRINPGQRPPRYGRPPGGGGAVALVALGVPLAVAIMTGAQALGIAPEHNMADRDARID